MTGAVLTPRVRIMAICDGVRESRTESGVFNLKGLRQVIVARAFPFCPTRLSLFVLLASFRAGAFPAYIRVVNDIDDKTVFYAHLEPTPSFSPNDELWAHVAPIRCSFPEAGQYSVQVWFFQEQASDVLKGELPFSVLTEGHNT
jgi:hypothetical protein